MRLFIAAVFGEGDVDRIAALRDSLHNVCTRGSFVEREKLHLTLEFLGECHHSAIARLEAVIDSLAFTPFDVRISRMGSFRRDGGDIWWVGMDRSDELMQLQSSLHDRLREEGFTLENRAYRPHITLARRVQGVETVPQVRPFTARVTNVFLFESAPTGRGYEYRPLYSVSRRGQHE